MILHEISLRESIYTSGITMISKLEAPKKNLSGR